MTAAVVAAKQCIYTVPSSPGVATFPQQPVPRDGRLRSNLCSVSETQLNFKTICKHLRPTAAACAPRLTYSIPSTTDLTSIFVSLSLVNKRANVCVYIILYGDESETKTK